MSEGIKKRVDDGTFNRLASDFGKGIDSIGAGMVNLVGKAEGIFGKLKDKVAEAKANREQERAERQAEQEERERKVEQLRAERLAMIENGGPEPSDGEEPYVAPIALPDDYMERLARYFEIDNENDLHMLCLTRLTAQTALFFANCDGDYTEQEREQIETFKEMVYEYLDGMEENSTDAIEFLFDGIERPCTIHDIMAMTHRFTDELDDKDRTGTLESIDWLVRKVLEANRRDDTRTEEYYNRWHSEFGL